MHKIKFMLLSLTLLTVVGGALAFKVQFGPLLLCTTIIMGVGPNPTCPLSNYFKLQPNPISFYTTTPNPNWVENPCKDDNGDWLDCFESTSKYVID